MDGMMTDRLERLFTQAVRRKIHNEGRPAVLGNAAQEIYLTDANGTVRGDTVWIRYVESDGTLTEAAVRNSGLPAVWGLPILVVNRNGVLTAIIDQFSLRMHTFTEGGGWIPLQQHGFTHRRLGTDPRYVEGLAFEPGLVTPSNPLAMTVDVLPGFFRYNGVDDVFPGGTSGSLAAYVPGVDNGINHFVIICLDRSVNTIVILDGDDYGDIYGATLSLADVVLIEIPEDYYPLAAVALYYGQTAVQVADIKFDRRRWLGDGGGTGGFALDVDKIMTDANGDVMVDAHGNVMIGA